MRYLKHGRIETMIDAHRAVMSIWLAGLTHGQSGLLALTHCVSAEASQKRSIEVDVTLNVCQMT